MREIGELLSDWNSSFDLSQLYGAIFMVYSGKIQLLFNATFIRKERSRLGEH